MDGDKLLSFDLLIGGNVPVELLLVVFRFAFQVALG